MIPLSDFSKLPTSKTKTDNMTQRPDPEKLLNLLWDQAPDHAFILLDREIHIISWLGAAHLRRLDFLRRALQGDRADLSIA